MSYVESNRAHWNTLADDYAGVARREWAKTAPTWGNFNVAQSQLPMLPAGLDGRDVLELGCGTGYVSAWVARAGGRPVGLDNSPRQLATARAMQEEFGIEFPLLHADAEHVPLAGRGGVVRPAARLIRPTCGSCAVSGVMTTDFSWIKTSECTPERAFGSLDRGVNRSATHSVRAGRGRRRAGRSAAGCGPRPRRRRR
jgi:SAM-dependent methyltransferase